MASKRKRRASNSMHGKGGLPAGEHLKRNKLAYGGGSSSIDYSAWGWVGTEAMDMSGITREHVLATCGFSSRRKGFPCCSNVYREEVLDGGVMVQGHKEGEEGKKKGKKKEEVVVEGEGEEGGDLGEDAIIVVTDEDVPRCNKKACRNNPNCLNYLGQDKWEDEDEARERFLKAAKLGFNPILDARDPNLPVGLKNLGATCYANAFLQVWFRDLAFRTGVYQCQPSQDSAQQFEKSPIFQLQVTFAALQESTQSVFNPTNFVESLQLRTAEQQDAQEFSKLFVSHLDAEFQKQSDPSLQSLITNQFQGKQVYGTICDNSNCDYRSERATDFLEIEINFEHNSNLEDRIAALLQPEKLSGDNKYLCPRCDSLQDATRYSELRQLPPILHFSLLRFVYDFDSMERKKSKYSISFPTSLDMGRFLGAACAGNSRVGHNRQERDIYELRGVLLHKGTSAYHGHYEAQVFDITSQSWYQFNDETVTKIVPSGEKRNTKRTASDRDNEDEKSSGSQGRKQRTNARKKRRIDDSDDEIIEITSSSPKGSLPDNSSSRISSKDAYMLIYSRKETPPNSNHSQPAVDTSLNILNPPARALDVVHKLNAAHDEACEKFQKREEEAKRIYEETRSKVRDIYRSWNPSINEESVIVSRQALERWLSEQSMPFPLGLPDIVGESQTDSEGIPTESNGRNGSCHEHLIDIDDILCTHGKLDPEKANDMKRISEDACQRIAAETHCKLRPVLSAQDICRTCVHAIFTERLYRIEHPRLVSQFDQLCDGEQEVPGFWISKQWLKDWRLVKPKMHVPAQDDPPPDDPEFDQQVRCEHGNLSLSSTARRRIPEPACKLLMDLYPSWTPMPSDTELCPVCDALIHISKEDKREVRKMAEEEKAKLKHMQEHALSGNILLLENVPCAVVPAQFVKSWLRWLWRPTEHARPDTIDNSQFICSHDQLNFDPNDPTDFDGSIAVITRNDWDSLEELYSGGPLISLENCVSDIESHRAFKFVHQVPVCADCRRKRKSDYEITEVTVRILGTTDSPTGPAVPSDAIIPANGRQTSILEYGSRRSGGGIRQSKRLQRVRENGVRRKVMISRFTTVKDIKLALQDKLNIPTICQRLFHHGQELEDNSATVASLGVLANDVLDLREESEVDGSIASDSEETPATKKRREEERGFGGTLLGQLSNVRAPSPSNLERPCPVCTFCNPPDVSICSMCTTPFAV